MTAGVIFIKLRTQLKTLKSSIKRKVVCESVSGDYDEIKRRHRIKLFRFGKIQAECKSLEFSLLNVIKIVYSRLFECTYVKRLRTSDNNQMR